MGPSNKAEYASRLLTVASYFLKDKFKHLIIGDYDVEVIEELYVSALYLARVYIKLYFCISMVKSVFICGAN